MCVIFVVENEGKRPTPEMVEKAWDWNRDGGGVAWRELNPKTGKVEVYWKKGITEFDEMQDIVDTLPIPFVAHFRITSQDGGGTCPQLSHPFPVNHKVSLALEGHTEDPVLFHNGNWKSWDDYVRSAALGSGVKLPVGRWSDTRGLAFLCSIYGLGFMELLPLQRGVAFSTDDVDIFVGPGWEFINGVWCSNKIFMDKGERRSEWNKVMCKDTHCFSKFNIDSDGYCPTHKLRKITFGSPEVAHTNVGPFLDKRPMIKVAEAKRLHEDGRISKNLLKAIKKAWDRMEDPKQRARAEHTIKACTQNILNP